MAILACQGRWRWMILGSAAGAMIVSSALWAGRSALSPPEWKVRLAREIPVFTSSTTGTVTEEAERQQHRILNNLLRRPSWGTGETRELRGVLRAGYPVPMNRGHALTREELSAAMVHMAAGVALIARLEVGAPVSTAAREEIIAAFLEELDEEFPDRRSTAAVALIVTRSIEDSLVRAAVERLLEDPDPGIAQVVALQLANYDDQRSRALAAADRNK